MLPHLTVPFTLDSTSKPGLPARPSLLAVWITPSVGSGPSTRHIATASDDSSIWVHSARIDTLPSPSVLPPGPSQPLPRILTSPPSRSSEAARRPSNLRKVSAVSHVSASSASSILSSSSPQRRRVTVFSPPASVAALATPTTAPVIAAGTEQPQPHRASISERRELREQLRHQAEDEPRSPGAIGLGISGLGRRSLHVHGREEHESGTTSPRSTVSYESQQTIGGRLRAWTRSSAEAERARSEDEKKDLDERMGEVEVERQMERELLDDEREKEDRKVVQEAISDQEARSSQKGTASGRASVRRLILGHPKGGRIVCLRVIEELDMLAVLRETGLLVHISLSSLQIGATVDLEEQSGLDSRESKLSAFWQWKNVNVARIGSDAHLCIDALPWPSPTPVSNEDLTLVAVVGLTEHGESQVVAKLDLPGGGLVAVCQHEGGTTLLHTTTTSMTAYSLETTVPSLPSTRPPSRPVTPRPTAHLRVTSAASTPAAPARSATPAGDSPRSAASSRKDHSQTGPRPQDETRKTNEKGFAKFLAARRAEWSKQRQPGHSETGSAVALGEGREVERDGHGEWHKWHLEADGYGLGIAVDSIHMFTFDGSRLRITGTIGLDGEESVLDAAVSEDRDRICVLRAASSVVYRRSATGWNVCWHSAEASDVIRNKKSFIMAQAESMIQLADADESAETLVQWRRDSSSKLPTWILPLRGGDLFVADRQGSVSKTTLGQLLGPAPTAASADIGQDRGEAPVTMLRLIKSTRDLLLAGDADGELRIWDTASFQLLASFALFDEPVAAVADVHTTTCPSLTGCVLVTARGGAVAVICTADLEHLYLIPASRAPLRRLFVNDHDILLAYANGKARVWNTQTLEFRRSTGLDAADEMLQDGKWEEVIMYSDAETSPLSRFQMRPQITDATDQALLLDLHNLHEWLEDQKSRPTAESLELLRALLALCLPFGADTSIDDLCQRKLGISPRTAASYMGHLASGTDLDVPMTGPGEAWTSSGEMTGTRQLVIVSLLRPFLATPEYEPWAAKVIAFYTASLPDDAVDASLDFFAEFYMDPARDVQEAARLLFAARVDRTSEQELEAIIHAHEWQLPINRSGDERYDDVAVNATILVGAIAVQKYTSTAPSALKAVAESIKLYLGLPPTKHIPLAIELCSRGFTIFQSYVDPMDLLRQLFSLSVIKSPPSIAAQARLAILNVANTNSALFMSTLSMDIMDAKTVDGRTSIMKLCVFMARKKPEVLEHSLPKIAEAVVKSLDPNIGKMRDDVWQAATVILNELVLAFSTIDFNSATQKLAVGTHEGAVIMYELKTASRLYVIEPHKSPISLVCFSPDGRRLLTVSLAERDLTVWKVGTSVSGFFNVGGPPRQGAGKGEPFKRIPFMRADDDPSEERTGLSDIKVDWLGDRKVRVSIKETALTFET